MPTKDTDTTSITIRVDIATGTPEQIKDARRRLQTAVKAALGGRPTVADARKHVAEVVLSPERVWELIEADAIEGLTRQQQEAANADRRNLIEQLRRPEPQDAELDGKADV